MSDILVLFWGTLLLFLYAILQAFGGLSVRLAARNKPSLRRFEKLSVVSALVIGFVLWAWVTKAALQVAPLLLPDAMAGGRIFAISVPAICYWCALVLAHFAYRGIFPRKWKAIARRT